MRSSRDISVLPAVPPGAAGTAPNIQERLLEVLSRQGPTHRAELARALDVSRTTVSKTVNELLENGLLLVLDEEDAGKVPGGMSPRLKRKLGLNPRRALLATFIFRMDRFEVALGTADGRLLAVQEEQVDPSSLGGERLERSRAIFRALLHEQSLSEEAVRGCYVALDTQIDEHSGEVHSEQASAIWYGTNAKRTVAGWVKDATIVVDNTARLATLAQYLAIQEPRPRCIVYVELSWGIGMGLVKDGVRFTGGHGGAGEIGHTSLDYRGELCECGNHGCLQNSVGVTAVLARARSALGEEVGFVDEIGARAAGDDTAARALVQEVGEDLGAGLVTVCNLLDPDLVVLGGELTGLGPDLLDAAERVMRRRALPLATRSLEVKYATRREDTRADVRTALWALRSQVGTSLV